MRTAQIATAKQSPTKVFDTPADVVAADIPDEEQAKILKNWEDEAHQLQAAADENMTGGEPSRLGEVRRAIAKLKNAGKI